jgi:alpha-ketoglutarate-dependent taurine dioxygenase
MNTPAFSTSSKRLGTIQRDAVAVATQDVVKTSSLLPAQSLPLVIEPRLDGVNLSSWASNNREFLEHSLHKHGGVLFRGFDLKGQDDFEQAVKSMAVELMHYMEGATPRVQLSENVYTSTEFPANQSIELHNELSYVITWPGRIWFFCVTPSQEGGETPIADVRKVLKRIDSAIVDRFVQKGWMLVRNFGNDMSLPWQKVFRTDDPSTLEAYCREAQIEREWIDSHRLRTRQVRPPVARHPRTREMIWFNHICFWHVSSLEPDVRESMLSVFGEENLPYNTYYGDGTPIEDSVIEEIREAYSQETIKFPWRKRDLLMLDNMLVAHGRQPFIGPRRILAAMGDPCSDRGL